MATPARHPPAPFTAPVSGTLDQKLAQIAAELNRKANSGIAGPSYHFLGLIDDTGATWKLTIDATGALHTELVSRS